MLKHLTDIFSFYGEYAGLRIARKHIGWYFKSLPSTYNDGLLAVLTADNTSSQINLLNKIFDLNSGK